MEMHEIIAIVTGGASGLGEATTRRIVSAGGKVAIFDMNEERGKALVRRTWRRPCFIPEDGCGERGKCEAERSRSCIGVWKGECGR